VADSLPLPEGLALDAATWEQTPLVMQPLVVQLRALIQQQAERSQALEARMADLEAHWQQRSHNCDRPPASDPPDEKRPARAGPPGKPGAKPGHRGHQQALLAPTEVIEVKPSACACGQTAGLDTSPDSTHQVIERPEIQMRVRHFVWYEAYCPLCGTVTKAQVPPAAAAGQGPRLTALIGARSGSQRDSRRAVQEFCASVLGVHISRGAIQRAVDRVSEAIQPHDDAMAAKAREAKVNDIDETTWYQHGVLA
jgi:transposase